MSRFPIVCLCGSSKQKDDWLRYQRALALKGCCVLSINLYPALEKPDGYNDEDDIKQMLEAIHLQKVEMADIIAVIPKPDGTIGDHTQKEIDRATELSKPIFFVEAVLAFPIWRLLTYIER